MSTIWPPLFYGSYVHYVSQLQASDVNGPVRFRFGPVKPIIKFEPVRSILAGLFGSVRGFSANRLTSRTRSVYM